MEQRRKNTAAATNTSAGAEERARYWDVIRTVWLRDRLGTVITDPTI